MYEISNQTYELNFGWIVRDFQPVLHSWGTRQTSFYPIHMLIYLDYSSRE